MKRKPAGLDRPSTVRVIKWMSTVNTWLYRRSNGRLGGRWRLGAGLRKPVPICLLTTTGRTSGQPRTVPLCFLQDGDAIVLVASQGGLPRHPQWYLNLRARPEVEIEIGPRRRRYSARVADAAERARWWPRLVDLYADFDSYQSWTDREIPVVVCEPAGGDGGPQ